MRPLLRNGNDSNLALDEDTPRQLLNPVEGRLDVTEGSPTFAQDSATVSIDEECTKNPCSSRESDTGNNNKTTHVDTVITLVPSTVTLGSSGGTECYTDSNNTSSCGHCHCHVNDGFIGDDNCGKK